MTSRCRICAYLFIPKSGGFLYAHCDYGVKTGRSRPCTVNNCTMCRVKRNTVPAEPVEEKKDGDAQCLEKR